jgi:hypothetical protein
MNRHVNLLQLLWNSCPKGPQFKNEKYLRQGIHYNGTSSHRFPWITQDIEFVDLRGPKFRSIDTADHTSNWFPKQHFEHKDFNLRHIQPSMEDQIWISQHTQWLLKQEPSAFSDPERCLQAHTEAIGRYLTARKLHQEVKLVDGQAPWTWLAVANS